jgi:hypothetical protein
MIYSSEIFVDVFVEATEETSVIWVNINREQQLHLPPLAHQYLHTEKSAIVLSTPFEK